MAEVNHIFVNRFNETIGVFCEICESNNTTISFCSFYKKCLKPNCTNYEFLSNICCEYLCETEKKGCILYLI